MQNLWQVFKFDLSQQFTRRAYRIMTFVVPLLLVVGVLGVQAYVDWRATRQSDEPAEDVQDEDVGQVGYVDLSGDFASPGMFSTALTRYDDAEAARAALDAGEIDTFYVIEADYAESGAITRYVTTLSLDAMDADAFFRSFLMDNLLRGVDRQLARRIQYDVSIVEHHVAIETGEASVARDSDVSFWLVYVFAILLAFATFFSGGYLLQSVIEEKESRMLEVILSSIRPLPLLAGKVLASGLLGLVQVIVWGAAAVFVLSRLGATFANLSDLSVRPDMIFWMLLYFLGGYLLFAGLYAGIGAVSQSMREGPQMVAFFTLPAMLPFYFITIFVENPNATLPVVLSLFPITAPLGMIQRLAVSPVPLGEILLSLALIALAAAAAIWFAARLFRVRTLLAGQTPRFRDLLQLVREG
ncbi:MAG: ABC transporter permease [Anaerolineae bacterium]|nr:ABC transporter permease [Anaerolineae bacterium]